MLLLAASLAISCVDNNINVARRACAFGSYELFEVHVEKAMSVLGCDQACNGCSLSSLNDCDKIAVLAAYSEEAGDPALERLHLASAHCLIPGGFTAVPTADIVQQIKSVPEMPCAGDTDIDDESWALFTAFAGFSTYILIETMLTERQSFKLPSDKTSLNLGAF